MKRTELKLLRLTLATVWLVTAALSFGLYPLNASLQLLAQVGAYGSLALVLLYSSATLDLVLGILTYATHGPGYGWSRLDLF